MSSPLLLSKRFSTSRVAGKRVCICFCAELASLLDFDVIRAALDRHFDNEGTPEILVFLGFEYNIDKFRELSDSKQLRLLLPYHIEGSDLFRLLHVCFNASGELTEKNSQHFGETIEDFADELCRKLATHIFHTRGALLVAPSGFHFVKPSTRHSTHFIRAAEALASSQDTFFLAAWLLKYVPRTAERIYCDSATIASLAYALIELHWRFDRNSASSITIDSFGGYAGAKNFTFFDTKETYFLISSSTSGGLNSYLARDRGIEITKIFLICYVGNTPPAGTIFNITLDEQLNPDGFPNVVSYKKEDCKLCNDGSRILSILGDQFLPVQPDIEVEKITSDLAPKWLSPFIRQFDGDICRVHHYDPKTNRNVHIYVDLVPLLKLADGELTSFQSILKQRIYQNMPRKIGAFIVLDDAGAEHLYENICKVLGDQEIRSIPKIPRSALTQGTGPWREVIRDGCVVVVSGVAASGRSLLAVSQILRTLARADSIYYVVALSRTPNVDALKDLRTDLTFGHFGPFTYRFDTVWNIHMPVYSSDQVSPWDHENQLLKAMCANELTAASPRLLAGAEARMDAIEALRKANSGGEQQLFLPALKERRNLKIRPNFSLVDDDLSRREFSQADIYFIVSAILHNIRQRRSKIPGAQTSDFVHHVWTPRTFERFNDGVVQAAILRASNFTELDYSGASSYSRMMRIILENIFGNAENDVGEAAGEFLLAIAQKKLKLAQPDFGSLIRFLDKFAPLDDLERELVNYVRTL